MSTQEEYKKKYPVKCTECGRRFVRNKKGTVRPHKVPFVNNYKLYYGPCPGSGKPEPTYPESSHEREQQRD